MPLPNRVIFDYRSIKRWRGRRGSVNGRCNVSRNFPPFFLFSFVIFSFFLFFFLFRYGKHKEYPWPNETTDDHSETIIEIHSESLDWVNEIELTFSYIFKKKKIKEKNYPSSQQQLSLIHSSTPK